MGCVMDLRLTERVAIVAAASKGLGRAVAEELAYVSSSDAICARTANALEETAAQIREATGREVFYRALDVADSKAVTGFVADVETRFGRLNICVTNSGGPPSNLFKNTPPEAWRSALNQLLMSATYFAKETLPRMQENKWGRLTTITWSAFRSERANHVNDALLAVDGGLVRSLL
jgi:3-oxoacyl-[acyl-carrier protein] reductase